MEIFSHVERTVASPSRYNEGKYEFYNRVAGTYRDQVRQLIEDWFSHFDPADRPDLRGRLQADDKRQFNGAFFELYLHESLLRMGHTVTCHPTVSGTQRRPDFRAEKDGRFFYLEARSASDSDAVTTSSARIDQVYDSLNKIDSPNFTLAVDLIRHTSKAFGARPLRRRVESWLRDLDPDQHMLGEAVGLEDLPFKRDEEEKSGWIIEFRAIGKPVEARGKSGVRPVGLMNDDLPWANEGGVGRALSDKGRAYGNLDAPFVVAVACQDMTLNDDDIAATLYGNGHWESVDGPAGEAVQLIHREPNGYWWDGDEWIHRGVSAVLVVPLLRATSVANQSHTIWEHPNPEFAIAKLPLWRRALHDNGMPVFVEPEAPQAKWFDLDEPWPAGEAFSVA